MFQVSKKLTRVDWVEKLDILPDGAAKLLVAPRPKPSSSTWPPPIDRNFAES